MKVYIVTIALFLSTLSFAKEESLTFKAKGFFYNVQSSLNAIKLDGYMIDLSLNKKVCNKNLVHSFHNQIINQFKNKVISETNFYSVTWNQKEYKISKTSDLGRFLYNLPHIFKANKKKESFLCRSKS